MRSTTRVLVVLIASRMAAVPLDDTDDTTDRSLRDFASRYMFATDAEIANGLDMQMNALARGSWQDFRGGGRTLQPPEPEIGAAVGDAADRWRVNMPRDEREWRLSPPPSRQDASRAAVTTAGDHGDEGEEGEEGELPMLGRHTAASAATVPPPDNAVVLRRAAPTTGAVPAPEPQEKRIWPPSRCRRFDFSVSGNPGPIETDIRNTRDGA